MFTKLTTATGLTLLLLGTTAQAEGFYISGSIIGTTQDHTIERNTAGTELPVPDVGGTSFVSETDLSGGVGLGYQQSFGNTGLFWGAEAFYNAEQGESRNINGVLVTDVELQASYGARLIAGAAVTDKFAVYAHAGVTEVEFDVTNSYTFAPPVTEASYSETGVSYGVGATYAIDDKVSVFAEYTQVDGITFDGIPEIAGGTGRVNPNSLDLSRTAIGVKYSF